MNFKELSDGNSFFVVKNNKLILFILCIATKMRNFQKNCEVFCENSHI